MPPRLSAQKPFSTDPRRAPRRLGAHSLARAARVATLWRVGARRIGSGSRVAFGCALILAWQLAGAALAHAVDGEETGTPTGTEGASEVVDETREASPEARQDREQEQGQVEEEEAGQGPRPGPLAPPPPVGVRFAEPLEDGRSLRVAYRWERIKSQGLAAGTNNLTPDYVRAAPPAGLGYTTTPRSLEVTVHTVEVAYAPHPRITLIAELPFLQKELETVDGTMGGARSQVETQGVGDIGFALVVPFIRKGNERSQIHVGFDAPTGAIRRGGDDTRLPYDNQIGNGTWDLEWGWTYRGEYQRLSWGGQATGRHPVGRNGLKYRHGSHFAGTLWGAVRVFDGVSTSFRTEWEKQNNISGFDRTLQPARDPAENAKLRGGERLTLFAGLAIDVPSLAGQRIAFEFGLPVYQRLDGPQLERDWSLTTAFQWAY